MSQMTISCPHCSQEVMGDTTYAGQTLACPNCSGEFVMPGDPPQQQRTAAAPQLKTAPAPQLKRPGRAPQLNRPGIAVKKSPAPAGAQSSQLNPSQQLPATTARGSQPLQGASSGLLYQAQPGFSRLFSDPVTGQREACDGMGPGKSLLFGLLFLFLFLLPTIIYIFVSNGILRSLPFAATPGFGRLSVMDHIMNTVNLIVLFAIIALVVWLLRLLCGKSGRFGEILLTTSFAAFWAFVFMLLSHLISRAGSPVNPSMVIIGLSTALSVFAGFAYCTIFYGTFRNLSQASGTASFWLTPTSIVTAMLLYFGYIWIFVKITT